MKTLIAILFLFFSVAVNAQWTRQYLPDWDTTCNNELREFNIYPVNNSNDILVQLNTQYVLVNKYGHGKEVDESTVDYDGLKSTISKIGPDGRLYEIRGQSAIYIDGEFRMDLGNSWLLSIAVSDQIGVVDWGGLRCLNLNDTAKDKFDNIHFADTGWFQNASNIIPNELGGFTYGLLTSPSNKRYCFYGPVIIKTDSTCQIQKLQTFDPVKVQKNFTHRDVRIFPNPSSGVFNVSGEFELIRVYDSTGRFIKEYKGRRIDLCQHPDGMYFMRVGESTFKVIKQ